RYVESLSAYARQFLEMMQKPDVDQIDGLSPAISIEQKTTSRNPRSTVGTVTEIYDYMRLLFARVGTAYSPATGLPIESQTVTQMVDRLMTLEEGARIYLLAPIVRGRKGEYRKEFAELMKQGFQRVKVNGEFYEIADAPVLDKKFKHNIDVVVDRLVIKTDLGNRLADSLETALGLADGLAVAEFADKKDDNGEPVRIMFSERFSCPVSGFTIDEIEPRLFSFNNPFGACPSCDGLGTELRFEADLVVPDKTLSLNKGAVLPWAKTGNTSPYYTQTLQAICRKYKGSMNKPWADLPEKLREVILNGSGEEPITFTYDDGLRSYKTRKSFEGVMGNIRRRWRETDSTWVREELTRFQTHHPCGECKGYRLKPQADAVKIAGKHIGHIAEMSISGAYQWYGNVEEHLSPQYKEIAKPVLKEIRERLKFLVDVGLEYL
ncbi:Excinuclease ABC subunit A, partial [hydrothermal vent metagenome]